MPKTNVSKKKIKPKESTSKCFQENETIYYVRDFYLKDFKYINQRVGVNKCDHTREGRNRVGVCRLFAKLWLIEVIRGLKQFLYDGSLHGVKYIFEPTFSRKERVTWVIIVVISIAFCAINIIKLLSKYTSTPYVNVIDSVPSPIWTIPFPTVVLCPHLHVKSSFANVSVLNNLQRFFAGLVCPQMKIQNIRLQHRLTVDEIKMLQEFIIQGSPTCKEVIKGCTWRTGNGSKWTADYCCNKLFKPIFTDHGHCFAFNSLPLYGFNNQTLPWVKTIDALAKSKSLLWNVDIGYPNAYPHDPNLVPWRIKAAGESSGLALDLYLNNTEYQFACEGNDIGFTVLIMTPLDNVFSSKIIRIPMNKMASIQVDPTTYKTEKNLRHLDPDVRQCYFQTERKLNYLSSYTSSNCKLDYFIEQARRNCSCVIFNWPRKDITEPVCTTKSDYDCIFKVRDVLEEQIMEGYTDSVDSPGGYSNSYGLSCYPSCNVVAYKSHVLFSNLLHEVENITHYDQFKKKKEFTQMNIHFQDYLFFGQHRHVQYDDYYFAGAIGGILSLFLGFSIISVAEFMYFVILKPIHVTFSQFYLQTHPNPKP